MNSDPNVQDSPEWVRALKDALAFPDARVILSAAEGAVAELVGPLELSGGPAEGKDWLRMGQESASHVHLRASVWKGLQYRHPEDRNASLEVLGAAGTAILRISFGRTNPAKPERFSPPRRAAADERFGRFTGPDGN